MTKIFLFASVIMLLTGCKDPYVDIEYELTCTEDLLEYVTPVVTYKGNEGNLVTLKISESDWKEKSDISLVNVNISSEYTVIVNGVEKKITNDAKRLYWQKKVSYGDFTIVEDELSVRYELKDGVTTDMLPKDFYPAHYISAQLDMRDEDNNDISRFFSTYVSRTGTNDILSDVDYKGFRVTRTGEIEEKEYKGHK